MPVRLAVTAASAAAITKVASRQSYLTIRWLADREYRDDAFALYAYFRWLDDTVDERLGDRGGRLAFVARQRDLLARAAGGATADELSRLGVSPEEALLVGLTRTTGARPSGARPTGARPADGLTVPGTGLLLSLNSMLDVMGFDARRRGRPVTQDELDAYTHDLAVSVTEALHHCIGHGCGCPRDESRYVAVTGAHVAHMLRDLAEDVVAGYRNLPAGLLPDDVVAGELLGYLHSPAVRAWVRDRVELARECFATGRTYLAQVESARCRLAGHAYVARFEWVLDAIERDGYALRLAYPERATFRGGLRIAADGARSAVAGRRLRRATR